MTSTIHDDKSPLLRCCGRKGKCCPERLPKSCGNRREERKANAKQILEVDNDGIIPAGIAAYLEECGFRAPTAEDGDTELPTLEHQQPDIECPLTRQMNSHVKQNPGT